jgi:hypothetical protein
VQETKRTNDAVAPMPGSYIPGLELDASLGFPLNRQVMGNQGCRVYVRLYAFALVCAGGSSAGRDRMNGLFLCVCVCVCVCVCLFFSTPTLLHRNVFLATPPESACGFKNWPGRKAD